MITTSKCKQNKESFIMEKLALTKDQQRMLDSLDKVIKKGNVNEMLKAIAVMMADGVQPKPRQIAKVSAHIFKTQNAGLNVEFATEFGGMGAFTEQMGKIVLARGNSEDNFDFAQYVIGSDKVAHGYAIYKKGNKQWWFAFVRRFPTIARQIERGATKSVDEKKKKKKNEKSAKDRKRGLDSIVTR